MGSKRVKVQHSHTELFVKNISSHRNGGPLMEMSIGVSVSEDNF